MSIKGEKLFLLILKFWFIHDHKINQYITVINLGYKRYFRVGHDLTIIRLNTADVYIAENKMGIVKAPTTSNLDKYLLKHFQDKMQWSA